MLKFLWIIGLAIGTNSLWAQADTSISQRLVRTFAAAEKHAWAAKSQPLEKPLADSLFRMGLSEYQHFIGATLPDFTPELYLWAVQSDSTRAAFAQQHASALSILQKKLSQTFYDDVYWHCVRMRAFDTAEMLRGHRNLFYQLGDKGCQCKGGHCQKHHQE